MIIQVPGLKQLCKQIFSLLQYFGFDLIVRALLLMDVPFLPSELLVFVAYSTFLCPSLWFWDVGKAFVEHPVLVQKSNYLLRSQLWVCLALLLFFAMFIKISHYWANTDFNFVIVHEKHRDDL